LPAAVSLGAAPIEQSKRRLLVALDAAAGWVGPAQIENALKIGTIVT
jgi:hypothetical protein